LALINNTDLRLGWEKDASITSDALWLGGFLRVFGEVGPYKIVREIDNEGEPVGYRMATPEEQLSSNDHATYLQLPQRKEFTFDYLTEQLKRSRTASARFVKRSQDLGLIKFVREIPNNNKGRPIRVYTKVSEEEFMR
jgi:hypothetical protein